MSLFRPRGARSHQNRPVPNGECLLASKCEDETKSRCSAGRNRRTIEQTLRRPLFSTSFNIRHSSGCFRFLNFPSSNNDNAGFVTWQSFDSRRIIQCNTVQKRSLIVPGCVLEKRGSQFKSMSTERSLAENARCDRPLIFGADLARFDRLISDGLINRAKLLLVLEEAAAAGCAPEELLVAEHVPRHRLLRYISDYYELPFVEYDEGLAAPLEIAHRVDFEELRKSLWFPLSLSGGIACVAVYNPRDGDLAEHIKATLGVTRLRLVVALPADIIRLIENQQDVNPNFPECSGRTPLAKLRTWLATRRTQLSQYRTTLAMGRTGLAFMRTGISFISIGLVLVRIFGVGYMSVLQSLLLVVGTIMTVDGIKWYLPARKADKENVVFEATEPTFGTTVTERVPSRDDIALARTDPVPGAKELRAQWNRLTPIMRRRFFAIDRTDHAEERTVLASYRSLMARARTGLAFTRTGISSVGLGIALLRQFKGGGPWVVFDGALILIGLAMAMEGFHWYLPGRQAGKESLEAVKRIHKRTSIWDFMFPPPQKEITLDDLPKPLTIKGTHSPGIWGTTGLALERTLIADRRNVKARLRTVMARSRTGMAFIRTGSRIFSVGLGLSVYFGTANIFWMIFNTALMLIGLILTLDGLYWHLPAEKIRKQFPYCFGDMEIVFPDYAKPSLAWKRVVFSHDDL